MLVKQSQLRAIPEMRDWQARAWEYYDCVGELRFATQWIANALSRCRLYVGMPDDDGGAPDPIGEDDAENARNADERARVPLDELFGGAAGHPEMLARLAMHLTVPGESYLIAFDSETADRTATTAGEGGRRWMVASAEEFTRAGGNQVKVRLPESDRQIPIKLDQSTVIRLWRPHPRRAWEADSPVRAALAVLKELIDLSAHITATLESRLAGAGVWLLPESAVLPAPLSQHGEPLHEDPAMSTLIDAMVTPLGDRDSAAAVVPIIVRVPDAAAGKSEFLTFATPLDEKIRELRDADIRRFATIVDIPAEVLTGTAEVNHWGMWKVEESAVKLHIEPLLGLICDALTTQYLWPSLRAMGIEDPESYVIWYDATDLILRPNRGPEAQNLYEHGLVKGMTVRRANGFNEDDRPNDDEAKRILLTQLAEKGIDPILVSPYLRALGIEIELPEGVTTDDWDPEVPAEPGAAPDGSAPPGSRVIGRPPLPTRLPTRPEPMPANPDAVDRPTVAALRAAPAPASNTLDLAAVEFAAVRALELAGKRCLNGANREWKGRLRRVEPWAIHTQIPIADVDDALDGAYALMHLCLPDHPCLHQVIDSYVRERLTSQRPHDRDQLRSLVEQAGCLTSGGGNRAIA